MLYDFPFMASLYKHMEHLKMHYLNFFGQNLLIKLATITKSTNEGTTMCVGDKKIDGLVLFQFSASVETGLKAGFLTANQKSEFVREVCISINHFTSHPKKTEREFIAKQIIAKYPCMASKVLVDSDTEWVCTIVKLTLYSSLKAVLKNSFLISTLVTI